MGKFQTTVRPGASRPSASLPAAIPATSPPQRDQARPECRARRARRRSTPPPKPPADTYHLQILVSMVSPVTPLLPRLRAGRSRVRCAIPPLPTTCRRFYVGRGVLPGGGGRG